MTVFIGADVLVAILVAAFLQDLAYTSKTVLVSRGRLTLAMAADVFAMVASSLYLILTASVTIRSGASIATVQAFAAIAVGGAGGTIAGMLVANWLEQRFTFASSPPRARLRDAGSPMVTLASRFGPVRPQSLLHSVLSPRSFADVGGPRGPYGATRHRMQGR